MTEQEARKFLEIIAPNLLGDSISVKSEKLRELMLKEYDAIDVAIEALKKQIPKKPEVHVMGYANSDRKAHWTMCPSCYEQRGFSYDILVDPIATYCRRCGQRIDWSEYNGKS